MRRRQGIRWQLFQLQLVSLVPIGLLAALLLYLHWHAQERERQRAQIESVRLLAVAVDNALDSTVQRLGILAQVWGTGSLNSADVHAQAKRAVAGSTDWAGVVAFHATGRSVFSTRAPYGAPVEGMRLDIWWPVLAERRPVVSDLVAEPSGKDWRVRVGVPVIQGNEVAYVLIADLDLDWYDRLLTEQRQVQGAVAGIFDRSFKFVACNKESVMRRGQDPTLELVRNMRARPEGVARYVNLNGERVITAWTFTGVGWAVGWSVPSAPVDKVFWNYLLVLGLLWATAVGGGMLYAMVKGRTIAATLKLVKEQAEDFAAGRRIGTRPESDVEEINSAIVSFEKARATLNSAMHERDRAMETERKARAAAEEANRAKDEFLAVLGHELRNPLAAISAAASIATIEGRTPSQSKFANEVIDRQSHHLKRLIDDLIDVGRLATGKISLVREPVELADSVRQAIAAQRSAEDLRGRHLEFEAATVYVDADRTRIEQIMSNLLINAARYSPAARPIRVRVAREGDEAVIQVTDQGRGIAADDLPRVFDSFFRVESDIKHSTRGLGIGLTLVRRLAQLHGGEVSAESDGLGKGATFTVRLPAIAVPASIQREPGPRTAARDVTVLVVEDNADARETLRVLLELQGYRVLQAANGAAATEVLRRVRPRVALIDIGLPGMDGYEVARRARAEFGQEIVLIALTGYGTPQDEEKAAQAGFDRHLTKPASADALAQAIESEDARSRHLTAKQA